MATDGKSIKVKIFGSEYPLRGESEEMTKKVAGYVDEKMQALSRAQKPVNKSNIAMLAALNIADEYHRLKESHEAILNRLNQLSKKLSTMLTEEG